MKKTLIFCMIILAALLIYEGIMLSNDTDGDTISEGMWVFFHQFPIFAFLIGQIMGMLMGHFWWPLTDKVRK